jgi:YegS/Rv2252/BmrU family lipid kinase
VDERELPKRAILIVNGGSRRGADLFEEARDRLTAAGIDVLDAKAVQSGEEMGAAVKDAITRAPMVIVGGGDGSLSSNVDDFVGKDVIFAFLPLGTANSFARTVGVPLDLEGAVDVIANGEPRKIDVGCIDGDYFLNAAALGLAPRVAESVPHGLKRALGRVGYLLWAGWSAANFKAFRLHLNDGRRTRHLWATEVRIANGRYHGGLELIESADVKSGEIVIQIVEGRSLMKLGWSYLTAALKLRARHEAVREFRGRWFRLDTRPRLQISIDGEVAATTPVEIRAIPAAVTIAAPREGPSPPG